MKKWSPIFIVFVFSAIASLAAETRLTTDGLIKRDPIFLGNSGEEIVFSHQEKPNLLRLMKLKVGDGKIEPLHTDAKGSEFEPASSADGRWLAFVQNRGNLTLALVIRDRAENKQYEVPAAGGFCGYSAPAFTPDGSRVLFSFADNGRQAIRSVSAKAGERQTLIEGQGTQNWPHVSPDGKQIVFSSTRDGNYEIYLAESTGQNVRRLTDSPLQDIRPRFSPDGLRIAFVSARDGNYEIYVMRTDGSDLRRVTTNAERDDFPAWHPDGKRLLLVSERAGKQDLYLIDAPQ